MLSQDKVAHHTQDHIHVRFTTDTISSQCIDSYGISKEDDTYIKNIDPNTNVYSLPVSLAPFIRFKDSSLNKDG